MSRPKSYPRNPEPKLLEEIPYLGLPPPEMTETYPVFEQPSFFYAKDHTDGPGGQILPKVPIFWPGISIQVENARRKEMHSVGWEPGFYQPPTECLESCPRLGNP